MLAKQNDTAVCYSDRNDNPFKFVKIMSAQRKKGVPKAVRNLFGVIMIVIYLGVGLLFLIGYFNIMFPTWTWVRWAGGVLFIAYGVWRGYRQFAGIDPGYGNEEDD